MRSVIRVGVTAGVVGCVALYLLARTSGLVAAFGIILLGFAVGLAMAKWLEWPWYGRQLEAGAQAGAIACIPAAAFALIALLSQGPHELAALETASHLGPVNAAGLAHAFGFAGWAGADVLSIVFCTLFAIGLAALTSIVMGWSKSARTVRSVSQAYEAARSLRSGTWNPTATTATTAMPAIQGSAAAVPAWQGAAQPASAPIGDGGLAWPGSRGAAASTDSYAPLNFHPSAPDATADAGNGHRSQPPANTPADDTQLRAAMREALAMWGDESGEHEASAPGDSGEHEAGDDQPDQPTERRKRKGQASRFLNDAKKRGRKKSDTHDWLC